MVRRSQSKTNDVFGGIDPGKDGYIVAYDGNEIVFEEPLPYLGSEIDPVALLRLFRRLKRLGVQVIYLENQAAFGPGGVTSIFNLGQSFMALKMGLIATGLRFQITRPNAWKKKMNCALANIKGAGLDDKQKKVKAAALKKKLKALANRRAQELAPDHDFRASPRCRVPHNGKCEAFLMAFLAFKEFRE